MRKTAALCEARYIRLLKRSTWIEIPSELDLCPEIQAPKRKVPVILRSFKGELENNAENFSASVDMLKDLTSVLSSEELSTSLSRKKLGSEINFMCQYGNAAEIEAS